MCDAKKREYILHFVQEAHWPPEQISNRLKLEFAEVQISYAAIYRAMTAEAARNTMTVLLGSLPPNKVKRVTPDRGTEFTL